MRRPLAALVIVLTLPALADAHDRHRRFDPVATPSGDLVNPYGRGFRGATGQGVLSGLFRPYVTDGPAVFRSSPLPPGPRRHFLGNVGQTIHILHNRFP